MNRKYKRKVTLLFAALLTVAGTVVAPSPSVQSEEAPAAQDKYQTIGKLPASADQPTKMQSKETFTWEFYPIFFDKSTGRSYYNAHTFDEERSYERTIYQDADGQWHSLEEGISVNWDYELGAIKLRRYGFGEGLSELFSTLYNPSNEVATTGVYWMGSDDNRYGLHYMKNYYTRQDTNGYWYSSEFILLQRTEDGVVREVGRTWHRPIYLSIPNGKVLVQQYSNTAKMNELLIYDPVSGLMKHLVYGSLDYYDPPSGRLLVNYNKPGRPIAVITLADGKIRPATEDDWQEFNRLLSEKEDAAPMPNTSTKPPADLQPQNLPVTPIQIRDQITARATIGGKVVYLSFAFIQNGRTMIPVRELMEQVGLEVIQQKVAGKVNSSSFTLKGPGGTETVTAADSMMIGDRLYVGSNVLKRIGLPIQGMNWNP
ncbi:hypothetical protein [Paenibacillus sp. Y412MC10]|uniref:hypothetical protein n=1 Tax=Geobacillus sp. (strain Y412MC10) TaxID=481743 RepID=UPI0011A74493|nr:hypothetical protein [Paenibacillus sp. Y412MC10]